MNKEYVAQWLLEHGIVQGESFVTALKRYVKDYKKNWFKQLGNIL